MASPLRGLEEVFAPLDGLRARQIALSAPTAHSQAARDGRLRIGRFAFELGHAALSVGLDHLEAWRVIVFARQIPTFAHFTLLRTAGDTSVLALWVCDPSIDAAERLRRGVGAQLADYTERRKFEDAAGSAGTPRTGKSARQRMQEVEAEARRYGVTGREPLGSTDLFARYASPPGMPERGESLYRMLSAIAHGKQWALLPMADFEKLSEPTQTSAGIARLTIKTDFAALATHSILEIVESAVAALERYAGPVPPGMRRR